MNTSTAIEDRLAHGPPIIIDGGTGTEIERLGAKMHSDAWSARASLTDPEIVRRVHTSFLDAGAEVIIANTYPANYHVMMHAGLGDEFEPANRRAIELAWEARAEFLERTKYRDVWVAGSMSTTTFSHGIDRSVIDAVEVPEKGYRAQARIIAAAGVDLVILEMMRDVEETRLCLDAAIETGLPVWLGLSAERNDVAGLVLFGSSIPFADGVAEILDRSDLPHAVGVMHSEIGITVEALEAVSRVWNGPTFAYPHHGVFDMPHWRFDNTLSTAEFAEAGLAWVGRGAAAVGGCCGIRPEHIDALRNRLIESRNYPSSS